MLNTSENIAAVAAATIEAAPVVPVVPVAASDAKPKRTRKPAAKRDENLPLVSPSGKRVPAKPEAAKPATVGKLAAAAKPVAAVKLPSAADAALAAENAKRTALAVAKREAVAKIYNGASRAFHTSRATSPGDILAVIASPNHKIAAGKPPTLRDASLASILLNFDTGTDVLDLLSLGADIGIISRLASIGVFTTDGKRAIIRTKAAMRAVSRECRPTADQLNPKAKAA